MLCDTLIRRYVPVAVTYTCRLGTYYIIGVHIIYNIAPVLGIPSSLSLSLQVPCVIII